MKAIIFGITGQDGTLLAKYLQNKGLIVVGTSRNINRINSNILKNFKIYEIDTLSFSQILKLIKDESPDFIYNLSGLTSVGKSFSEPLETYQTIVSTTLYLLESIRIAKPEIKFFNASSTECFGFSNIIGLTEESPFKPLSPYATAKVMAHNLANDYRSNYGIFVCTGILSNHESHLRSSEFISMKIIEAAYKISKGSQNYLEVGDTTIIRDWGWAEDYIEGMFLMMNQEKPDDYILATGNSITLEDFINYAFGKFNLDYKKYVRVNNLFIRKNEIKKIYLNPQKASDKLGWKSKNTVYQVVDKLIDYTCLRTF